MTAEDLRGGEKRPVTHTSLGREEHFGWIWFWREISLSMYVEYIREQGYDMRAYSGEGFFRVRVCITLPPGLGPLVPSFVHPINLEPAPPP